MTSAKLNEYSSTLTEWASKKNVEPCISEKAHTEQTNNILELLFNEIHHSAMSVQKAIQINTPAFYNLKVTSINNKNPIPYASTFNNESLPPFTLTHIKENTKSQISYSTIIFGVKKVSVFFLTEDKDPQSNIEMYNRYFQRMIIWLKIAFKYSNSDCGNDLDIYLYMAPFKKELPKSEADIIGQVHANTGFTYTCPKGKSEIVLYRSEEWFKVFVHESFHLLALDFSGLNVISKCKNYLQEIFPIKSDFLIFESYTETWAIILNTCLIAYLILPERTLENFLDTFDTMIRFEVMFKTFQMKKILDFMGLEYKDLYSKTRKSKIARDNLYREKTNVFAYSIIGTILLINYQEFMEWCNTNNLSLLSFKKTHPNVFSFCDFIKKKYKSKFTLNSISQVSNERCYGKLMKNAEKYKWIQNTLRMSMFELK
jgi:hypothetical protein